MKRLLVTLLLSASAIHADGVFSIGHKNFGFSIGQQSAYGHDYTVIGASVNYMVADNISAGLAYQTWLGDDPSINQITLPVTYHVPLEAPYRPYVGAFYSHTFMGDDGRYVYEDYDSYGYRLGAAFNTSETSYAAVGMVHEFYSTGGDNIYPEVLFGMSF